MSTITVYAVCKAYYDARESGYSTMPVPLLRSRTGASVEECTKTIEAAVEAGYIDYGLVQDCGWITGAGEDFVRAKGAIRDA